MSHTAVQGSMGSHYAMGISSHRIYLYEYENFQGSMMELSGECRNICDRNIRVECGPWVGYQNPGYHGYQYLFEFGSYKHWKEWCANHPQIQSVRRVRDMQTHPRGCFEMA